MPLIDERCTKFGILVLPPRPVGRLRWELSHLWLTVKDNWEDVPDWAKMYRKDHLHGDHHVSMLAYMLNGKPVEGNHLFLLGILAGPSSPKVFSPDMWHGCWGTTPLEGNNSYYGHLTFAPSSIVKGMRADITADGPHTSFFLVFQEAEVHPEITKQPALADFEGLLVGEDWKREEK